MTDGPANPSLPSALTSLQRKLAVGWTHHVTGPAAGTVTLGGLSVATDGEGKRSRITREVPVTSYALKACHAATGRAFVAVWMHRLDDVTAKGKPRWSLDIAIRGRHEGEHTPRHLTAQQLAAYAGSRTLAEYREYGPARWGRSTELLSSVDTGEGKAA